MTTLLLFLLGNWKRTIKVGMFDPIRFFHGSIQWDAIHSIFVSIQQYTIQSWIDTKVSSIETKNRIVFIYQPYKNILVLYSTSAYYS